MAIRTWDGGGSDELASTAANWSNDTAPIDGDSVVFDGTSTKNCTFDINSLTLAALTFASGYTGTFTRTSATLTITGDLKIHADAVVKFGNGCTWNIGGSYDPDTTATNFGNNFSGATLNLTGTGYFGVVRSSAADPSHGIVNIAIGADYEMTSGSTPSGSSGDIDAVEFHNYGTFHSEGELDFQGARSNTSDFPTTKVYNHSTGVFGGGGSIIFRGKSQWLLQDGAVNISLGIIYWRPGMSLCPGTWNGSNFTIYLGRTTLDQIFYWSAGTYNFTGTGNFATYNDVPGSFTCIVDNSANAIINISQPVVDFTSGGSGVPLDGWIAGQSGKLVLKNASVTITMPAIILDSIENGTGASITLASNLSCVSLTLANSGTFNQAGFDLNCERDLIVANPAQYSPTGLNGSAVTVRGSLLVSGILGTLLNWGASSGWTLAVEGGPLNTANATYVSVANCNATGLAVQAVNCTNGGSNTNWNFSAVSGTRRNNSYKIRSGALTLAAGARNIEADLSGDSIVAKIDAVQVTEFSDATLNQSVKAHGLLQYFNGTKQLCPIDNFDFPDPTVVPVAPTGLGVTTDALATWHPYPGALTYSLRRSPAGAGTWTVVGTPTLPTYQDSIPATGDFDYQVAAVNSHGLGAYSATVTVSYVLITGAVSLVAASSQSLSRASIASLDMTADWTVAGWMNHNAPSGVSYATIFGKANPFESGGSRGWFAVISNDLGWFLVNAYPADGSGVAQINVTSDYTQAPHYVEVYWDQAAKILYAEADNVAVGNVSIPSGLTNNANPFRIGITSGYSYFDGKEGPVRIWSRMLTGGERTSMYNGGSPKVYSAMTTGEKVGLLASFDWLTTGTLLSDSTGNGNTLTNNNGATIDNF